MGHGGEPWKMHEIVFDVSCAASALSSPALSWPLQGTAMRICVAHETMYHYETPSSGVIQTLRLTPRNHTGQYVVAWRIDVSADCRLEPQEDAFGNTIHAFSTSGP